MEDDEDLERRGLHRSGYHLHNSLLLGDPCFKEFAVMATVLFAVMLPSKTALMEMLAWAKASYQRAIMPKDAKYWEERIEELKGLI